MDIIDTTYDTGNYQFLPFAEEMQTIITNRARKTPIQKEVDILTKEILTKGNIPPDKYSIIVFRSDALQVFHAQGGKIFIPDTLMRMARSKERKIFIIAHEIGHWENQDIVNNSVQRFLSPGQRRESECRADTYAWEINKLLTYDAQSIKKFLGELKSKRLRPDYCNDGGESN